MNIFGRTTATDYTMEECRVIVKFLRNEPLRWLLSSVWKARRYSAEYARNVGISRSSR